MTCLSLPSSRARLLVALGFVIALLGGALIMLIDIAWEFTTSSLSCQQTFTIPPASQNSSYDNHHEFVESLADGTIKYDRIDGEADPHLLWLVLTFDKSSWGREPGLVLKHQRSFEDFLQLLTDTTLDTQNISLGLMTSSTADFKHFITATQQYHFARLTIILHAGFNPDAVLDREHRHDNESQQARRSELAQLRNYLMLSTLRKERHVIWLDADVYYLDQSVVQRMISHSESRDDVGIITARCEAPWGPNFDLNAWAGSYKHEKVVPDIVKDTTDDDLLPLTAVGATLLYIRASLVRQGVNFPYYYAVNTKWTEEGDDGIESEGICYQARAMKGGGCFVLGGSWHTKHGD